MDMVVEINEEGSSSSRWYFMTMTAGDVQRQPRLASALDVHADNQLVISMILPYSLGRAWS